ncbi:MAG: hypothetical protein H6727_19090 [Myxococcales bacterium]|nr:hypothetical protein [Myxococcales bacterium]
MYNYPLHSKDYDAILFAYLDALEKGDFEQVNTILRLAEHDEQLDEALQELHESLYTEEIAESITSQESSPTLLTHSFRPLAPITSPQVSAPKPPALPLDTQQSPEPASKARSVFSWASILFSTMLFGLILWKGPQIISKNSPLTGLTKTTTKAKTAQQILKTCLQPRPKTPPHTWLEGSWIASLQRDPEKLKTLLETKLVREDILALLQTHRLPEAIARHLPPNKLTAFHKVIRARLFLRMARFHRKNYDLALQYNEAVYTRRLQQAQYLQLGKHFYYYWGRLQCLQGKRTEATHTLLHALRQPDTQRKQRIQAWLLACRPKPLSPTQLAAQLAQLDFRQDPDGWSEWILLHHYFHLTPQVQPQPQTQRARFYARVWQQKPVQWKQTWLRDPIDQEQIEEQGIRSEIDYFDPATFLMIADAYAQQALRLLRQTSPQDRYAPFFRADALALLRKQNQAQQQWLHFLSQRPKKIRWEYLLFSHRHSPNFLRDEACYHAALSPRTPLPTSHAILKELASGFYPTRALAGLGMLRLHHKEAQGYAWLLEGLRFADDERTRLQKLFAYATQHEGTPERRKYARFIQQLQLERYAVRSLYVWGSIGAMLKQDPSLASRWMERLHYKDEPYRLSGWNEPVHFSWTARAYTYAGNLAVATLFFAKNREAYPSLNQLWSLLRIWRIYEGMHNTPVVKGG